MGEYLKDGIDTEIERNKIDYKPNITYTKLYDIQPIAPLEIQDIDIEYIKSQTPSVSLYRVSKIVEEYSNIKKELEARLYNDIIEIDIDRYPQISEAIIKKCPLNKDGVIYNDDKINFTMYKKALGDSNDKDSALIVDAYEEHHAGINGKFEVELYKIVDLEMKNWENTLTMLLNSYADSTTDDITLETIQKSLGREDPPIVELWTDLEYQKKKIRDRIDSDEFDQLDALEQELLKMKLQSLESKTDSIRKSKKFEIARMANYIASDGENNLAKVKNVLRMTACDLMGGTVDCFITKMINQLLSGQNSKIVSGADVIGRVSQDIGMINDIMNVNDINDRLSKGKDFDKVKEVLDEAIKVVRVIKSHLKYAIIGVDISMKSIVGKLLEIVNGIISKVAELVLNEIGKLVDNLAMQGYQILGNMLNSVEDDCISYEELGNYIYDGIEDIQEKFHKLLLDVYKLANLNNNAEDKGLSLIMNKQWIRVAYLISDAIERQLVVIRDNIYDIKNISVRKMADDITRELGLDITWSSIENKFVKSTLKCGDKQSEASDDSGGM